MEEISPRNASPKLIVQSSSSPPSSTGKTNISGFENEPGIELKGTTETCQQKRLQKGHDGKRKTFKKVICLAVIFKFGFTKNNTENREAATNEFNNSFRICCFDLKNISSSSLSSMLKRSSYSMEFDSGSKSTEAVGNSTKEEDESSHQTGKKICNSSSFENIPEELADGNRSQQSSQARTEPFPRYSQTGENSHVIQSRSIFSRKDGFVYGNPKEEIKRMEEPPQGKISPLEIDSGNALDLSFKGGGSSGSGSSSSSSKPDEEKFEDGNTYQNHQRGHLERSNPISKKPSFPEQLQIAKIQQQQRRSMQQHQKFLQQMRRSLETKVSSSGRQETTQKSVKHCGNNGTSQEQSLDGLDNHQRGVKEEFHNRISGSHFPHFPHPYYDPNQTKELPDNHPILPLLDPVYFSALYNAHGFLPPSSPSIAAAFIGTLQDALPKFPMIFPSTSTNNSQKSNENPN